MNAEQVADFACELRRLLARPLPGPRVQRQLAPELAFGRHRGPYATDARQAAVIALMHPADGSDRGDTSQRLNTTSARDWILPAIVRPEQMSFHAGQIALPGGMVEPGESPVDAGLRELQEELGPGAGQVQVLGQLTPVYVFVSKAVVTPIVAFAPQRPRWEPNPAEVAEVVDIGLDALLAPVSRGSHTIRRRGLAMRAPHFHVAGRWIWGATAMILAEFAAVLSAARMQSRVAEESDGV